MVVAVVATGFLFRLGMDRMDMFHLQYSPGCFFCSVSAAQRAQIAQRAICHVSPLLPTEAYQTRNLPKENRIPFNPTSFLVATPQTNQQSLLLRGSNSHCSVLSLANSVNLAKKSKAPLTDSYQRCKYEKQPPKKMFATVLEDTFFET